MLVGAIIIFFYLLKLRRTRLVVPSVLLWQRAMEEAEANAPFRRLRRSLLLLLQLLVLAALVFALAQPLVSRRALASGNTVIIIDTTASMNSRDEDGSTRLERALQIAHEMIDGLGADDRAAIIESSSRVTLRTALTSDRATLRSTLDQVSQTDAAGNLSDAVRLAEQIVKTEHQGSIVVIGDGGGGGDTGPGLRPAGDTLVDQTPLKFIRIGTRSENVGIVALNARAIRNSGRQELFASLANFGERDRNLDAELRVNDKLIDARSISVPAKGRIALVFDSLPSAGGLGELRLAVQDDLEADNSAFCFIPDSRRIRVGVASNNSFLLGAVSVDQEVDARRVEQASTTAIAQFDCLVSDGAAPAAMLESNRPLLLINPPDTGGLCRSTGPIDHPAIGAIARSHPINAYLNLTDLHIERSTQRETARWLQPVLSAVGGGGLIWAGEGGQRRVVLIGFDLAASDFPLQVDFPVFIANAIAWLAGRDLAGSARAIRVGQPAVIRRAGAAATVTGPDGLTSEVEATSDGSVVFADAFRVGKYDVAGGDSFGASLLNQSESDTTPRNQVRTRGGDLVTRGDSFHSEREVWRWVALAALVMLAIEWWVYHRRIA